MPKSAAARKRRNIKSTAAVLVYDPDAEVPALPALPDKRDPEVGLVQDVWSPSAVDFWREVWTSPMAQMYTEADAHGLYMIAVLVHRFHTAEDVEESRKIHAEIRAARRDFGLTPMSRASLHWTIAEAGNADERLKTTKRRRPPADASAELAALGP